MDDTQTLVGGTLSIISTTTVFESKPGFVLSLVIIRYIIFSGLRRSEVRTDLGSGFTIGVLRRRQRCGEQGRERTHQRKDPSEDGQRPTTDYSGRGTGERGPSPPNKLFSECPQGPEVE